MNTNFPSYEIAPDLGNNTFKILFSQNSEKTYREVAPHWHRQIEILYWTHGNCEFYCNHNKYDVNTGDIIIANSNELHKSENSSPDTARYAILISPDFFLAKEDGISPTFTNLIKNNPVCREYIDTIIEHFNRNEPFCKTHLTGLTFCFLVYLLRNFTLSVESGKSIETKLSNREKINRVVLYIGEHYMESITVSQLARLVYLSDSYLEHLFKDELAISITQYINNVRVTSAINILGNHNDIPIQKLAELVGINDYNYFTRLFKKHTGSTPSFYKREFKIQNKYPPA